MRYFAALGHSIKTRSNRSVLLRGCDQPLSPLARLPCLRKNSIPFGDLTIKRILAIAVLATLATPAAAAEMRFFNDAQGRPQGSSTQFGDMTFYNDSQGRPVGSATRFGDQTFYNDSMGRPAGSSTTFGGDE